MYITNKSRCSKLSSVLLSLFFLIVFTLPAYAVDLPFDPNDFTFLIYDPEGEESSIVSAMEKILVVDTFDPNNIRTSAPGEGVTMEDLSTHDILIVGWNDSSGDVSGLDANVLAAGITGRVLLTGHDADFHMVNDIQAAEVFLVQAIDWVLKGSGTGLITLGCTDAFPYLPEFWDVNVTENWGNDVNQFTEEGLASGVYDDLEPDKMSNWLASYHDTFTIEQFSLFVPFELGGYDSNDIITIACDNIKLPYFSIHKDANGVNCVSPLISEAEHEFMGEPYNWLYYNIDCNAIGYADTNVYITDHLPDEVNFISCEPNDGVYDPIMHTVTWEIPVMSASDSNTYRIQCAVNYYAKPGHKITNLCVMEGDLYYKYTTIDTDVCCYGVDIIYVDVNANGFNNGTSWLHAYNDLQDALHSARKCGREQIWVAEGTYKPAKADRSISFELIDNVAIYGGFPPGGGAWPQRNPDVYETILSGDIGTSDYKYDNSYHVVKCVDVNNAVLDGFTITAGRANDGDPCSGGGIYCQDSNNFALADCNVSGNSAKYGAGIYDYNSSDVKITNCVLTGNTASDYGGGLYNYLSSPTIISCTFTMNKSTINDSRGGGMYNEHSSPTLINCTFSDNSMGLWGKGGAIYNTDQDSKPNMTNCTFANNSADIGGAVYNVHSEPNITNCVFSGNDANTYGGGIYCQYGSAEVANCVFAKNNAVNHGGGIYSYDSPLNVTNCIFADNIVTKSFSSGGGICNKDCSLVSIAYCIFTGNSAVKYGGGVYNDSSDSNIANCIFTSNDANMGGGLYNTSSIQNITISITNCIFVGNTADSYGGGIYNYDNPFSSVIVSNCIFSGNISYIYGGGIANHFNTSLVLANCTVSGNSAYYGGGIFSWHYADTDLTNCILWNNAVDEIHKDDSSTLAVKYSDIKGWTGGVDGNIDKDPCFFVVDQSTVTWTVDTFYDNSTFQSTLTDENADWAVNELAGKFINPDVDPYQHLQFFIVSNDVNTMKVWSDVNDIAGVGDTYYIYDYHLRVESPCIDTGDPNGDYYGQKDIDGEPRVFDGDYNDVPIVDMGADEYYWSPADINSDGFVNFFDYTFFASAWQSDPNKTNYNEDCDLEDNNSIDYNDIALFCEDWLWQTAWAKAFPSAYDELWGRSMSMGMGEGFFPSMQAKQPQPELTAADIEQILKWLADLWLTNEEVRKTIPEDEWLEFIEAVIQAAKEQTYN